MGSYKLKKLTPQKLLYGTSPHCFLCRDDHRVDALRFARTAGDSERITFRDGTPQAFNHYGVFDRVDFCFHDAAKGEYGFDQYPAAGVDVYCWRDCAFVRFNADVSECLVCDL